MTNFLGRFWTKSSWLIIWLFNFCIFSSSRQYNGLYISYKYFNLTEKCLRIVHRLAKSWKFQPREIIRVYSIQYCMQKMWLGGQTESLQNVGGASVYDVLTLQKSKGGKSSPRGGKDPPTPPPPTSKCSPDISLTYFYKLLRLKDLTILNTLNIPSHIFLSCLKLKFLTHYKFHWATCIF